MKCNVILQWYGANRNKPTQYKIYFSIFFLEVKSLIIFLFCKNFVKTLIVFFFILQKLRECFDSSRKNFVRILIHLFYFQLKFRQSIEFFFFFFFFQLQKFRQNINALNIRLYLLFCRNFVKPNDELNLLFCENYVKMVFT